MAFAASEQTDDRHVLPVALKVLIAGGFGVGKTTLVGAVSEIRPLSTEEALSVAGTPVDNLTGVERKTTTTVALDFGRITIREDLTVYLFGTPGQERFWFMWDELASGAIGAVVLADTRRLADCFPSVDFFENRKIPFVLAVNCFDDAPRYRPAGRQVRGGPGGTGTRGDVRRPAAQLQQGRADRAGRAFAADAAATGRAAPPDEQLPQNGRGPQHTP